MKNLSFSVIIANFNGEKYLPKCLSSVFKTSYPEFDVIIVEDGSNDKSLKIINKFAKKNIFTLIKNEKNLGLVLSRNKAIKAAKGEILVFLDNDTEVDKNWLKGLSRVFGENNEVAAAQCKIFDFNKRNIIQQVGMKLTAYTGFGTPLGRGERDHGQYDKSSEIISLGAALAVKKIIAKKIGGFDKNLFHYTDDLDFSWRIWIAGYKIVLAPEAKIYHYIKIHNPNYKLYYHLTKNSIRMLLKNYEFLNVIKFLPVSLIFNFAGVLYVLLSRRSFSGILGFLFGLFWNLLNIGDTLSERMKIQGLRRCPDSLILNKVMISTNIFDIYKMYFKTAKKTDLLMRTN